MVSLILGVSLALIARSPAGIEDTALADHLRSRGAAAAAVFWPAEGVLDLAPTTHYVDVETNREFSQVDLFVVGSVVDVEFGKAYVSQDFEDGSPDWREVEPDSGEASWATLYLTVDPSFVSDPTGAAPTRDHFVGSMFFGTVNGDEIQFPFAPSNFDLAFDLSVVSISAIEEAASTRREIEVVFDGGFDGGTPVRVDDVAELARRGLDVSAIVEAAG